MRFSSVTDSKAQKRGVTIKSMVSTTSDKNEDGDLLTKLGISTLDDGENEVEIESDAIMDEAK